MRARALHVTNSTKYQVPGNILTTDCCVAGTYWYMKKNGGDFRCRISGFSSDLRHQDLRLQIFGTDL